MTVKLRLYETRFKRKRVVIYDGIRWRRVAEPWAIDMSRETKSTSVLRAMGWKDAPFPAPSITLTAPGFEAVRVDSIESVA